MPVLPDEKALKRWFEAEGTQPAVAVIGDWEETREDILAALSAKDRYILELEKDKRFFSIESVRKMMAACTTTTPFGRRLIVIPHCERLTLPAAQALLKFLEEPTAGNRILMVTKFPKRLLPTIRSRVQIVRLIPTSDVANPVSTSDVVTGIDPLKLLTSKNRRGLAKEELISIHKMVEARAGGAGMSGPAYRALLRLRDYYKIRSLGGNEKLASDILLASLLELEREMR